MKKGLLIVNLGTPSHPNIKSVASYLSEFLTDRRVIDLPWPIRYFLVYCLIVPFRSKWSLEAYKAIWQRNGSPLLLFSQKLLQELQKKPSEYTTIALAMRYGKPSIEQALTQLGSCDAITIMPLYPQYSSAATGSSLEEILTLLKPWERIPTLNIISEFYNHPAYIKVQTQVITQHLQPEAHLLFSYHGIPERQIKKTGCASICDKACPPIELANTACYRAQCYETSRLLAQELSISEENYSTSFQSRLGKTPWIKPYTDELLEGLASRGIQHLAICCPSFVADCLETLEEINMRAQEQWIKLGGKSFQLIPCLNDSPQWAEAILEITLQK